MEDKKLFVGIDISKSTLDVTLLKNEEIQCHQKIQNSRKSIDVFFNKLINNYNAYEIYVAMENTGYYNWKLYDALNEFNLKVYVINPFHLNRSIGLARGKNDKVDAYRIAAFISTHYKKLKTTILPRKKVRELQSILAQRDRLIESRKRQKAAISEMKVATCQINDTIIEVNKETLESFNRSIKKLEQTMHKLVSKDKRLSALYKFITSVPGVGKVIAWYLLVKTNEFKSINNPRKLACYCGVVPFEYQSGSSVFKKSSVSYMADKQMKKLLQMAALRVTRMEGELQKYYQRKVKEGKNKMSVQNALRNKILARVCSVVNNEKMYQKNLNLS